MHQVSDRAISMQIGEVAKLTTLTVDAIRFYERRACFPKLLAQWDASGSIPMMTWFGWALSGKCKAWVSP